MSERLWVLKGSIFHFATKCFRNGRKLQKTAQNEPKLRSVAKIARLHENAKVAQKLRYATSQFSGGL